jgi:hypothetical protein
MSVRVPIIDVDAAPIPQFTPRSRREDSTRDIANARNIEVRQSGPQIQQGFFRPEPSSGNTNPNPNGCKRDASFFDQTPLASRYQAPISLPGPTFDPNGSKLEGNPYFDQHAASFDPRNVARELNAAVKEDKMDRGILESQRLLSRGFSSRYVPQGFAEQQQFDSLQAFEALRPKIDDGTRQYRTY